MDVFFPLNGCVSVEMETSSHVSPPVDVLLHHNISRDALDLNDQVPVGLVKNAWCIYTHTKTHIAISS